MSATYAPGRLAVLVGPTAVVMAPGDRIDELVRLAEAAEPDALGVIHLLSGGDLTRLPDFACIVATDGDLRAVVRGRFRISCGDWCLDGLGAATWHEQRVVRVPGEAIAVQVIDEEPSTGQQLPLHHGVVLASAVAWRPEGVSESPRDETPTPVRIPVPAQRPDVEDIPIVAPVATPTVVPPPPAPTRISAPPMPVAPPTSAPSSYDSDHDGRTVTAAQLEAMRAEALTTPPPEAQTSRPRVIVQVPGHADVVVRKSVLIGRSPRATQTSSAQLPALVVVDDLYVSGTHVEIRFDGDLPVVIDRSRNGTVITHIGQAPEQLTKDVPAPLSDGAMLSLSEAVSARVRFGPVG